MADFKLNQVVVAGDADQADKQGGEDAMLDDDRDQENLCEYSEDLDWVDHDWDSDPEWGP